MVEFVENRRYYFFFSAVLIGAGILSMLISLANSGLPFGIGVDFRSGTRFEFQFTQPVTEQQLRDLFQSLGVNNPAVIQLQGEGITNGWQIRTEFVPDEQAQALEKAVAEQVAPLQPNTTLVESVSASVGAEVTQSAFIAIAVASIIILGYIAFAFRQVPHPVRYGLCALSALFHDLFMIFGFMAVMSMLLGWEADALFVTAVLTIAGFSVQDTIVVFDRIRENLTARPYEPYPTIVNRSLLETIHRSLATQLCAMFVMVALILFGGASITQFISVLLVGMLSGTYSSIFHAVPLLAEWEIRALAREATAGEAE